MSFENRARVQIIAELLKLAKTPTKKTRMLYGANLSFKQAQQYLALMSKANLLDKKEGNESRRKTVLFSTTVNGKKFLVHYDALLKLAPFLK
ncbi:MAG: winged helix-turn-helix domain-containing protein [Nitrososphaerales archaeon]